MAYLNRTNHKPNPKKQFRDVSSSSNKPVIASVEVRNNDVDQALRVLKKQLQRDGFFKELKAKQHFTPATSLRREALTKAKGLAVKIEIKKLVKEGFTKDEAKAFVRKRKFG